MGQGQLAEPQADRLRQDTLDDLYDPAYERESCGIGMVAHIHGRRSHGLVKQALDALASMTHRGGIGAEQDSGDGAGILTQIPDAYFRKVCQPLGMLLPRPGEYGVGMLFLTRDDARRGQVEAEFARIAEESGQRFLGWRDVPVRTERLGASALAAMPAIRQAFIAKNARVEDELSFERALYVIRKRAERRLREPNPQDFYACSLSCRTIVYKGMLLAPQLEELYPDLRDLDYDSALALVHSRFSTNTFPSWERAHPNRCLVHNGEINTIKGNVQRMRARQQHISTDVFGVPVSEVLPIIREDGSDSAMFDNCLEFLALTGRGLAHAAMMMVPAPWEKYREMPPALRAFYEFHSHILAAWDGPAAIAFTDGVSIGAMLDRNGLRPARYAVTLDDMVILTSEAGAVEIPASNVRLQDRLQPGCMALVDTAAGRFYTDSEIKAAVAGQQPYRAWIDRLRVDIDALPLDGASLPDMPRKLPFATAQRAFGYTYEQREKLLRPMAETGQEAVGSMGTDSPLAALSDAPQLLYDYFHHQFAQVTNPPIDAIREEIVTSLRVYIGPEGDLLRPSPLCCKQIRLHSPILSEKRMRGLAALGAVETNPDREPDAKPDRNGLRAAILPIVYNAADGGAGLRVALSNLEKAAEDAFNLGCSILILSDRDTDREHAAIPALLAVTCVQRHTVQKGMRTRLSILLDSAEPREVHHIALLVGYGVTAICPYAAIETVRTMAGEGFIGKSPDDAEANYLHALEKGLLKMLSKMGISAVQSYRGAQPFEAVGLGPEIIDRYFPGTPSRLGGLTLDELARETASRHASAFGPDADESRELPSGGVYQYRRDSEPHLLNPESIHLLQRACWDDDLESFRNYARSIDEGKPVTLRSLLRFKAASPIPLDQVEPVESIVKRFKTGAMSYGSISQEAHECMAVAMNRLGGKSNTGEGGEDEARFLDERCSAIKQVASGRFGVTSGYLVSAREIQIKMAQGAKPGEGGQLPGAKVSPSIARTRHSTPGVGLISPPPHHDIYSIEDLAELIYDLKNANPDARVSVKLVAEAGVGTIAAGVAKGMADVILISGYDGGTGASPRTSIRHAGLPWELGLAETHQTLVRNRLRTRVTLETDGKLLTGRDVAVAALLGAEEFGFSTGPLISMGCVMMRVCNLDSCPVGIATQNETLRSRFRGKPEYVARFMTFVAGQLREIMASLGLRTVDEMVGRADLLEPVATDHWKRRALNFDKLLRPAPVAIQYRTDRHTLGDTLDSSTLAVLAEPALSKGQCARGSLRVQNIHRTIGTRLGSEVTKRFGPKGLPDDTIRFDLVGYAGQSFGAWLPRGITLSLTGQANDYVGKGLSGGRLIIRPPEDAAYDSRESILLGNVALYGATEGVALFAGAAGERFAVRNSGALAVVEGVGDHGCEYMTGGRVVVLGRTGRNFAAGMTGGVAYALDTDGGFASRCNPGSVALEPMDQPEEIVWLRGMLETHRSRTGSRFALEILERWNDWIPRFARVMPDEYRSAWKEGFTQWVG
ncbi:MAG: glutamate synthase large subunit [Oscillospiraceae bacterium]|jgi:glutamate synthase (ferredoxin)|nr:glutamate synthase large subunit [Oscillospiraceae bacterium]